ncbi:MAG: addiction module protein [Planctomycetota bacterium]
MGLPKIDVRTLTPDERLELMNQIWETFVEAPESLPLTEAQRAELDRRMKASDEGRMPTEPWEEVVKRLRLRLRKRPAR